MLATSTSRSPSSCGRSGRSGAACAGVRPPLHRPERLGPLVRARARRRRSRDRPRLPAGEPDVTTALILLPIAGALWVWITPWSSARAAGGSALLVALGELALWIGTAANFDFSRAGGLQFETTQTWFADLGVSYHVGLTTLTVWLVGMTVLVSAVANRVWVLGRGGTASPPTSGLLLFLEGATVGVFAAQDLLVFYVFWEAMMIPLYVLIGVWGGPGRLGATIKFVVYTMAGSLLMLVSIIALGLSRGSFDLEAAARRGRERVDLPRVPSGFRRERRPCGPSTAGSRTPIASRRPRWPPCSRASSRRRPPTASCHRHPALPDRGGRLARAGPRARLDRARSTARCSRSGRPTSAA